MSQDRVCLSAVLLQGGTSDAKHVFDHQERPTSIIESDQGDVGELGRGGVP